MNARLFSNTLAAAALLLAACAPAAAPAPTSAPPPPTAAPKPAATTAPAAAPTTAPAAATAAPAKPTAAPAAPTQAAQPTVAAKPAAKAPIKATVLVGTNVPVASLAPQTSLPITLGYWQDEGLDVEVQTGIQGDAQAVQLLGTDQGTVGVIDPTTLMNAREKGVPLKSVYIYARQPLNSMYVLQDSPLKSVADLKGKTLGSYSTTGGALNESKYILKMAGLELEKDVQFVNIGFDAATIEALKSGQADAYTVTEPDVLEQLGNLKFRKLDDPASQDRFGFVWVFSEKTIKEQPDVVVGLMRGVAKATLFAVTNPTAAVQAHYKVYPQAKPQGVDDATAVQRGVAGVQGRYAKYKLEGPDAKWGTIPNEDARWKIMVDEALLGGSITAPIDVTTVHTRDFIAKINEFDSKSVIDQANTYKP
jgi:NitT/TauT family transport system substrate-binding protein